MLEGKAYKEELKTKMKCLKCKADGYRTALSNPESETSSATDDNKENSASCLVKCSTGILLQTVTVLAADDKESHCC